MKETSLNSIRTKIIAVAKDEGAYLAEWIFHHLYKGFDEIEILINRTTDDSREIVERISKGYPQVSYSNSDFIDWIPGTASKKFQHLAYANALERTLQHSGNTITHIMFLDVDEFWIHEDSSITISDYLAAMETDKGVSFSWLNELPTSEVFQMLSSAFVGERSSLVKSIFPVSRGIKKVRPHQPLLKDNQYINADGTRWEEKSGIAENSVKSVYSPAFVYHRMYRSPMEYVSTLATGSMRGAEIPFKTNRHGLPRVRKESLVTVALEHEKWLSYESKRREFMEELGMLGEVAQQLWDGDSVAMMGIHMIRDTLDGATRLQALEMIIEEELPGSASRNAALIVAIQTLQEDGDIEAAADLMVELVLSN